ncbi:unnamed protein product, partial [marine sediment metagenome]
MIKIKKTSCDFEREPLLGKFGFKGGYVSGVWQSAALMGSENGNTVVGLGTQSPLWSDAKVFAGTSEAGGNSLMFLMTEHALNAAEGMEFDTPMDLFDRLLPETYEYGKKITGREDLRPTFALNALVAVDNAAWMLYCLEEGIGNFDEMVPEEFRPALSK